MATGDFKAFIILLVSSNKAHENEATRYLPPTSRSLLFGRDIEVLKIPSQSSSGLSLLSHIPCQGKEGLLLGSGSQLALPCVHTSAFPCRLLLSS